MTRAEAGGPPSHHIPEYLIEATLLGLFMVSACLFTVLLEYAGSPIRQAIDSALARRALIGLVMGLTAVCLIYSPWGRRSGAHFNPAATVTFLRLGKMAPWDAAWYVLAQFVGGATGVLLAASVMPAVMHPSVHYAVTQPGVAGVTVAFIAECVLTFAQMSVILRVSNTPGLARYTGLIAGSLIALYITFEAPLSGMSMNPARTFASALAAQDWTALWIYFTAPPLGMLLAAEVYVRLGGRAACAKLHHDARYPCLFCANQAQKKAESLSASREPISSPEHSGKGNTFSRR